MKRLTFILMLAVGAAAITVGAQTGSDADKLLAAARHLEVVEGDLAGALKAYQTIVDKYQTADRAAGSQALLQMAACYEKLGNGAAARSTYERIVKEFGDQPVAAKARARVSPQDRDDVGIWTENPPEPAYVSFSRDGQSLLYLSASGNLTLRDLRTGADRQLTDSASGEVVSDAAVISPDGKSVAYPALVGPGKYEFRIRRVDGGATQAPRTLARSGGNDDAYVVPSDWSANGEKIAAQIRRSDRTTQIVLVDVKTGNVDVIRTIGWRPSTRIALSPGGQYIAYDAPAGDTIVQRDVHVLAVDGSRLVSVATGQGMDTIAGWSPDGQDVVYRSDTHGSMGLWAQRMADGKPTGGPRLVRDDFRGEPLRVTTGGALAYYSFTRNQHIRVVSVDLSTGARSAETSVPAPDRSTFRHHPRWSATGQMLAYISARFPADNDRTLSIQTLATGLMTDVPLRLQYINNFDWAPDHRTLIARATDLQGRQGIFRIDASSGAADPIALNLGDTSYFHPQWSPDGRLIFYVRGTDLGTRGLQRDPTQMYVERDLASGLERVLFRTADLRDAEGAPLPPLRLESLAPDRRHLLAFTMQGQESSLFAIDVTRASAKRILRLPRRRAFGPNGGVEWTPDGRALIANVAGAMPGDPRELWYIPLDGSPRRLEAGLDTIVESSIAVHPDGNHIAVLAGAPVKIELRLLNGLL